MGERHAATTQGFFKERKSVVLAVAHPPLGGGEGPRGYPCGGEMGSPSPPHAPIFWHFFLFSRDFLLVFMGIRRMRPCYHALRHPFGAADRAMLLN